MPGVLTALVLIAACGGKTPPVARPLPPRPGRRCDARARGPPAPPEPVAEPTVVPPEPVRDDAIASASLDDLNRNSPLKPVFFDYDSSEITARARQCSTRTPRCSSATRPGPSRSKVTATNAGPPSTIWRWASDARSRRAPTSSRSAFRPIGSGPSATARNSRSIPARRGRVREEPARAFRHHRKVRHGHADIPTAPAVASSVLMVLLAAVLAPRRRPQPTRNAADDGRHPDAAGAVAAAPERRSASMTEALKARQRAPRRAGRQRPARRSPTRSWSWTALIERPARRPREGRRQQRARRLADAGSRRAAAGRRAAESRRRRPRRRPPMPAPAPPADPGAPAGRHARRCAGAAPAAAIGMSPTQAVRRGARRLHAGAVRPRDLGLRGVHRELPACRAGRRRAGAHRQLVPERRQDTTRPSRRTTWRSAPIRRRHVVPDAYYKQGHGARRACGSRTGAGGVRGRDQDVPDSDAATLASQRLQELDRSQARLGWRLGIETRLG